MLQNEVLIFELVTIDGFTTGAVVIGKITTLTHKARNDTVKGGPSVAETFFASAQCTEIFGSFWNNIGTKLGGKQQN